MTSSNAENDSKPIIISSIIISVMCQCGRSQCVSVCQDVRLFSLRMCLHA